MFGFGRDKQVKKDKDAEEVLRRIVPVVMGRELKEKLDPDGEMICDEVRDDFFVAYRAKEIVGVPEEQCFFMTKKAADRLGIREVGRNKALLEAAGKNLEFEYGMELSPVGDRFWRYSGRNYENFNASIIIGKNAMDGILKMMGTEEAYIAILNVHACVLADGKDVEASYALKALLDGSKKKCDKEERVTEYLYHYDGKLQLLSQVGFAKESDNA